MLDKYNIILTEVKSVLEKITEEEIFQLIEQIIKANKIVCCGAGKVGMAIRGFAMRLGHFGFNAHTLGDSTVPSIGKGDLLIVASGSGETQTIFDLVSIASKNGATIVAITGNPESRIGKLANDCVKISAPSKTKRDETGMISIQPMTTLNEQCLTLFFDGVVLYMMDKLGETHETMWARHSNLE